MAGVYLDTSALGRVLLGEPAAPAVLGALERFDEHVASRLLAVELSRLALRFELTDEANRLLGAIALVPVDEGILAAAGEVMPASVTTLDAIHLVTAIRLAGAGFVDAVMTYDARLAEGARNNGLDVVSPG